MKIKSKYYKDVIKSRMYKNAASIWGVRDIDNFDPVLKLLVEALASEINKLSNEMENMEVRLLERLAAILTPDLFLAVRPAHMILHAKPVEEEATVGKSYVIQYKKQESSVIDFSPAGTFRLLDGDVHALICAGTYYGIDSQKSKEMIEKSRRRSEKFTGNLWIGMKIHPSLREIRNLSFYFDLPNIEKRNDLFDLLPYSRWEQDGGRLSIHTGIECEPDPDGEHFPLASFDPSKLSEESILEHYNRRFITVRGKIVNNKNKYGVLPDEIAEFFPEVQSDGGLMPLLWLKITLPPGFDDYILDDFFVSINAFPVINRRFYSQTAKSTPLVSLFRFETDVNEYFLSIDRVSDSNRRRYMPLPYRQVMKDDEDMGTYILKRAGAERFDSRNARESISNIVDLLREENSSFAMLGQSFILDMVRTIDAELVAMDSKLSAVRINRDISSYLVIDSEEAGETLYVDYWVTNCESANGIKSGAKMIQKGGLLASNSIITLTQSYGGKRRSDHTPEMYKYSLTTRDRIYTEEDIVNFCHAHFGDRISSATVTKGVRVSPRPREGLIRSIDVHVKLNENAPAGPSIQQDMEDRLLSLLKQRSPEMYHYSVYITRSNQDNL
ncbi:MAG: type VI secretion system baseplate subunit TssF [Tannerella sp.]|jgi:hypothetical protein|nr:type VI secretion system baseplate subunit TssF [Tannerella sp.]